ncbi:F0F1 ATP synthase subunit B [Corynebacterium kroppenstedtii]|uniref:F0F1 ATP synthase subunit B n=1 Tax=uncultured Corynebacterium sp. TaxID=159447 RepID=UPI0025F8E855|nr:F0F1 ATP synthase subunit B [uncultured Corynebacterium sp.]
MTNSLILAEDTLPLEKGNLPLLPLPYDLVWSIVCFVLILWLFWKFVLPKFQEVLSEREDRIEGGIQRAEAAQSEAKAALQKYNDQLAEARAEAARIRDEARADGQKIVADMKTEATEESNRIIAQGEKQLAAQRDAVVADLRKDMGQNSVNLAEKLLGSHLSDDAKRAETVDSFLSSLDDIPAGK